MLSGSKPSNRLHGLRRLFAHQIIQFFLVSVLATLIDYLVLWVLSILLPGGRLYNTIAIAAGYTVGTTVNYVVARRRVFQPSSLHATWEFVLVFLVAFIGLGVTEWITLWLHESWHWHLLIAKTAAVVIVFFWNFFARRRLIYRHSPPAPSEDSISQTPVK